MYFIKPNMCFVMWISTTFLVKIFKRTAGDFKEKGGDGGAIRPKIAIFKEEKWVCYGAKILRELRCYNISA